MKSGHLVCQLLAQGTDLVPVLWVVWHATIVQHCSASNSSIRCWPGTRTLCPIPCRQNPALGQELLGNPVPPFRPFSLKPCPHAPASPAAPAQWDWLELRWPPLWSSRKLSEAEGGTDMALTSGLALEDHSLGGLLPTPGICICVLPRVTVVMAGGQESLQESAREQLSRWPQAPTW